MWCCFCMSICYFPFFILTSRLMKNRKVFLPARRLCLPLSLTICLCISASCEEKKMFWQIIPISENKVTTTEWNTVTKKSTVWCLNIYLLWSPFLPGHCFFLSTLTFIKLSSSEHDMRFFSLKEFKKHKNLRTIFLRVQQILYVSTLI